MNFKGRSKNWLVYSIFEKKLKTLSEVFLSGKMIDIGCGEKQYEQMLDPHIDEYIGLDHKDTMHDLSKADLVGTAYEIPVEDASFDCALCTAVLEHLEEPEQALRECNRVLKKEGIAIYSIPFIWHLHEKPRDFYRYSKYGIEYLFNKTGFEILKLEALSGFWVTFGQLFVYYIYRFNRGPLRWFKIVAILGFIIQLIAYCLDKLDKAEDWTWMYVVVAKKKA